jgi:ABC-type sugar transport system, ATPase component
MGAGRTELARALIGADPKTAGKIYLRGKEIKIKSPSGCPLNLESEYLS